MNCCKRMRNRNSLTTEERIDTTYGDIAEFGGEGPETRRINVEGVHLSGMTWHDYGECFGSRHLQECSWWSGQGPKRVANVNMMPRRYPNYSVWLRWALNISNQLMEIQFFHALQATPVPRFLGLQIRPGNAYLRSSFPRLSYILRARPLDWVPVGGARGAMPFFIALHWWRLCCCTLFRSRSSHLIGRVYATSVGRYE